jgi:hypothetical protein
VDHPFDVMYDDGKAARPQLATHRLHHQRPRKPETGDGVRRFRQRHQSTVRSATGQTTENRDIAAAAPDSGCRHSSLIESRNFPGSCTPWNRSPADCVKVRAGTASAHHRECLPWFSGSAPPAKTIDGRCPCGNGLTCDRRLCIAAARARGATAHWCGGRNGQARHCRPTCVAGKHNATCTTVRPTKQQCPVSRHHGRHRQTFLTSAFTTCRRDMDRVAGRYHKVVCRRSAVVESVRVRFHDWRTPTNGERTIPFAPEPVEGIRSTL